MAYDWVATFFTLVGVYLIGCKRKVGFLMGALGCIGWFIVGTMNDLGGMLGTNVVVFFMNLHCWWKWHRKEKKEKSATSENKLESSLEEACTSTGCDADH